MLLIIAILLCITFMGSIVYSSLVLGISPTPSSPRLLKQTIKHLPKEYAGIFYECGAGFGFSCYFLSKHFPKASIIAYEKSPFPYLVSKIVLLVSGSKNVTLRYENFLDDRFERGSILFCYLSVNIMQKLEKKLLQEAFSGQVVSHTFAFSSLKPENMLVSSDLYQTRSYHYLF